MSTPYQPSYQSQPVPPAMPVAPPPPRSRRWLLAIGGAALAVTAVAATVIALVPGEEELTVGLALFDPDGVSCASGGSGGFSDIGPGMPITVRDQAGKIIGSGALPDHGEAAGGGMGCVWTTTVTVPDDAEQYAVEGGDRGAVTFARQKLEENGWEAALSIGM